MIFKMITRVLAGCVAIMIGFANSSIGQTRTLLIRVLDSQTKQPIEHVIVFVNDSLTGTPSNRLGFLQVNVPAATNQLLLARTGFTTGMVAIPGDKFTAAIERAVVVLPDIIFAEPTKADFQLSASATIPGQYNAEFPAGWNSFFESMKKSIRLDSAFKDTSEFTIQTVFTIHATGDATVNQIKPEIHPIGKAIKRVIENLPAFIPAKQNTVPVDQQFSIRIRSADVVFDEPDISPEFPGGYERMIDFIRTNLKFPSEARKKRESGTVIVQFVVEKNGALAEFKVIQGVSPSLDKEALRVVRKMAKWKPGSQAGEAVRTRFSLPVRFKIDE